MTETATLARRDTSLTLNIREESSSIWIARDLGKPNLIIQPTGRIDPRSADFWSGQQIINLNSYFLTNAYEKARRLANFIKSSTAGRDTTLDTSLSRYPSSMSVVPNPAQDAALELTYEPGSEGIVQYNLTLMRVSDILGGASLSASTPTALGAGPVTLSDGSTTIDISTDQTFTRQVGRPNSTVKRGTGTYPRYIDMHRSSFDAWQIDFQDFNQTLSDIVGLFESQLGRSSLTLDFNGVFDLGSFSVVPQGSQALRQVERVGEQGIVRFPQVNLRVVNNG